MQLISSAMLFGDNLSVPAKTSVAYARKLARLLGESAMGVTPFCAFELRGIRNTADQSSIRRKDPSAEQGWAFAIFTGGLRVYVPASFRRLPLRVREFQTDIFYLFG
jgi:hypothetical protein